jgi:hypothetical protein
MKVAPVAARADLPTMNVVPIPVAGSVVEQKARRLIPCSWRSIRTKTARSPKTRSMTAPNPF